MKIMKQASKTRQGTGLADAQELLNLVQQFAEMFWQTKGAKTKRQPSLQKVRRRARRYRRRPRTRAARRLRTRRMTETLPVDGRSLVARAVPRGGSGTARGLDLERGRRRGRGRAGTRSNGSWTPGGRSTASRPASGRSPTAPIPREKLRELQASLVRSHASGTGPALPRRPGAGRDAAAPQFARPGALGVRTRSWSVWSSSSTTGSSRWIPEQGSVGASGDLAPLAHLALALTGEGAFVDERTRTVRAGRETSSGARGSRRWSSRRRRGWPSSTARP